MQALKKLLLIVLIVIVSCNKSKTCICLSELDYKPFCSTINFWMTYDIEPVIIMGVVDTIFESSMIVKVEDKIVGEPLDTLISILGHDGANCGSGLNFSKGDSLVLNLISYCDYYGFTGIKDYDFYLDGCGTNDLLLKNNILEGRYDVDIDKVDYQDFIKNVQNCFTNTVGLITTSIQQIDVYPNPFTDIINIASKENYFTEVSIFNSRGELVIKEYFSELKNKIKIALNSLNKGIYIVKVTSKHNSITKRIVKI